MNEQVSQQWSFILSQKSNDQSSSKDLCTVVVSINIQLLTTDLTQPLQISTPTERSELGAVWILASMFEVLEAVCPDAAFERRQTCHCVSAQLEVEHLQSTAYEYCMCMYSTYCMLSGDIYLSSVTAQKLLKLLQFLTL